MYRFLSILTILIIISTVPIVSAEVIRGESTLPDWVKNTAGWWASEQIPDAAFLQTIEFLIKEEIIIVQIPAVDSVVEEIPGWVKNTAGWWAEDKIHDTTFVAAVRYLVSQGIVYVEREQVEEPVEEVEEITDFYMEVNGGSCCLNWAYVGDEYKFQIETQDSQHGKYIDDVKINAKIISKDGELRHDFGEVTTDDGIYNNSIIIPSMDWYAENILSVTGEYFGVEKTIEKEFEVFRGQGTSSSYGASAGGSAHVGPFSVASQETIPVGIAFSKSGMKMFIVGSDGDDVNEYTLTCAYCIGTASFVDSFDITSSNAIATVHGPTDIAFSKSGMKMFIVDTGTHNDVHEYTLTAAWDVSTASFVVSFSVQSQTGAPTGIAFSKSGEKMFVVESGGSSHHDWVLEYTLATAWDVSSASYVDLFSVRGEDRAPQDIAFSKSGEKMFIVGNQWDNVLEYTLATAWDVSSASFVDYLDISSQEETPTGIWFDSSGKTMFILGNDGDDVNVYKLTIAWDVSTASFVG